MATFLLTHAHAAEECAAAFASWRGMDSPLRHRPALGSCAKGGHCLWWTVEAASAQAALALLPEYVAARTEATEVAPLPIP